MVVDDRDRVAYNHLRKGLAETASFAPHERVEGQRVTVLAIGLFVPLAAWIKPVWHVTRGFLPLEGVLVHRINAHVENIVLPDRQPVEHRHITTEALLTRNADWGLNAQRLVVALVQIVEVHDRVVVKFGSDVVLRSLHYRDDLSHQLLLHVWVLGQVPNEVGGRKLDCFHAGCEERQNLINDQTVLISVKIVADQNLQQICGAFSIRLPLAGASVVDDLLDKTPQVLSVTGCSPITLRYRVEVKGEEKDVDADRGTCSNPQKSSGDCLAHRNLFDTSIFFLIINLQLGCTRSNRGVDDDSALEIQGELANVNDRLVLILNSLDFLKRYFLDTVCHRNEFGLRESSGKNLTFLSIISMVRVLDDNALWRKLTPDIPHDRRLGGRGVLLDINVFQVVARVDLQNHCHWENKARHRRYLFRTTGFLQDIKPRKLPFVLLLPVPDSCHISPDGETESVARSDHSLRAVESVLEVGRNNLPCEEGHNEHSEKN